MKKKASIVVNAPSTTGPTVPVAEKDIGKTRNTALLHTAAENVQHLDSRSLITVQTILGHGDRYGFWKTPEEWAPAQHGTASINIDLRKRIADFLEPALLPLWKEANEGPLQQGTSSSVDGDRTLSDVARINWLIEGAVLSLTRYLILLRMGPAAFVGKRKGGSLDPTTVRTLAYDNLPRLFAACVSKMFGDASVSGNVAEATDSVPAAGYMSYVPRDHLDSLSKTGRKKTTFEFQRMFVLGLKGYWNDVPILSEQLDAVTAVAGDPVPKEGESKTKPHLPLPDDYVSDMGSRSLWLIESIAPNLFPILKEFQRIWRETDIPSLEPTQVESRRRTKVEAYLEKCGWRDRAGKLIDVPPFPLYVRRIGGPGKTRSDDELLNSSLDEQGEGLEDINWPPHTAHEIFGLAHAVQLAHLFVVALPMAARRSEIVTLERSCVQYAADGFPYADGRTFKLVERHDGAIRDWVLPDVSVNAIEQQVRLIGLLETLGSMQPDRSESKIAQSPQLPGRHLWAQSGHGGADRTKRLVTLGKALIQFAKTLGMDPQPGGQNIRPHRLRKTIARLVALALMQAPKVLMDVFGHKSLEMTLYYILTDKELRAEIERVTRELRIIRATEIIEEMVANEDAVSGAVPTGGYGGPAALAMQRAIDMQKEGLHRSGEEWGAANAVELAEILTLQGKAWQFVRPGVICTKFPGTESGPCNKSKGHPEPARCQTHCRHRLEEKFLREDVDGAIRDSVTAYIDAGEAGELLVQALWAGQIRAHLVRFEDIKHKWLSDPVVQRILAEEESEGVSA
ncbi:hypothetical protein [Paraburkholderia sp. D1E]|uniref:hypothetical protein n=1 Tax=Paraburkholderia sp. D1E TaxID=3461398 RepID=UPI0040459F25